MNKNKWFEEGVSAFQNNYETQSPYEACTIEFFFWKAGWEEALRHSLAIGEHPKQLGCKAKDE